MRAEVYLGLGSNLGHRAANIARGLELLGHVSENRAVSSLYETTPSGFRSQPPFLNAACRIWTTLNPFQLMAKIRQVEVTAGRRRAFQNGPRTLDIDILAFGRAIFDTPGLTIPHPRMAGRRFVLEPLAEIAPGLVHPILGETIRTLLRSLAPGHDAVLRIPTKRDARSGTSPRTDPSESLPKESKA